MAMNGTRWGDSIAAAVKAIGITAGTAITDDQLKLVWEAVAGENVTELTGNADVLPTPHSGLPLEASVGIAVATTGSAVAQTGATTAPGPLEGKGSLA